MRRIMINASLCDGCKTAPSPVCRHTGIPPGTVYDLDLTDIHNESRNHIEKCRTAVTARFSADTVIYRSVSCPA